MRFMAEGAAWTQAGGKLSVVRDGRRRLLISVLSHSVFADYLLIRVMSL